MPGQFMWFDLTTTAPDRAREFYAAMFDWPVAPEAGAGRYRGWITDGEQPWAGVVQAEPATAGHWVPYVVVDDLADATKRAVSLGATLVKEATDGPAGTSVTIADPGGAHLALFKPFA